MLTCSHLLVMWFTSFHPAAVCPATLPAWVRYENEELLRYMWPTDVWFHVDDLSSAHVSDRVPGGQGDRVGCLSILLLATA
jgi:hypothetical protein